MSVENGPKVVNKDTTQPQQLVVIIMGSESDMSHADKITKTLDHFGVRHTMRVASAHKTPEHALAILREYGKPDDSEKNNQVVFIAVVGRSNALGGFLDANTISPVISSPPKGEWYDVFSSLRMPSGISAPVTIEAEAAALHAVKILGLSNPQLAAKYEAYQESLRQTIYDTDQEIFLSKR